MSTLTQDVTGNPPPPPTGGRGGDDGRGGGHGGPRRVSYTGLLVLLASTTMVFAAFTSAFVVRRGISNDWQPTPVPPILYLNTVVLLASSLALERARWALKRGYRTSFNRYWTLGTLLGAGFLAGQWLGWVRLHQMGFLIATSPSSSFFYVLTAAHAAHLLGGVGALLYVDVQALRLRLGPAKRTVADIAAIFWHFLDGVWIFLLALFYFWG
jgi:cytochrome c oxidase subunit III